jgi:hypothetical protein
LKQLPRYLPALMLALMLGACTEQAGNPVVDSTAMTTEADTVLEEIAALPPAEPEIPPPPPPIPVPAPESLVGYYEVGLENLFGQPEFVRRDPPAELWQYHTESCVLDLFLYENESGNYLVDHIEFRETGTSPAEKEDCLRDIILSAE